MDQTEALIIETIDRHRDEIIEFARDIYTHAELGYKEFQTSGKFVKKKKWNNWDCGLKRDLRSQE